MLPDEIRIPLHSLQADIAYLFGRVAADGSCADAMVQSVRERLNEIENAYDSTEALREALANALRALEFSRAELKEYELAATGEDYNSPAINAAIDEASTALSASPAPDNDLANRVRAHVERLANTDMQLPLDEWCGISNDILRCADAMTSGRPSIGASPAPSTEGLREWLPIAGAPKDQNIIVAAMNTYSKTWIVGEAHWQSDDPDHPDDGDWWWANISPGDYTGDSIFNMNGPVEFWQLLPPAPDAARTALAGVTAPPDTFDLEAFLADELEPGELRPCPFCGGKAEIHEFDDVGEDDENFGGSAIMCTQCQCSTAVYFDRKEHLYSSWNERSKPVAPSVGVTAPSEGGK